MMYESGDVVLTNIQFVDAFTIKTRPAVVLYEAFGNIVVAGITSNQQMQGIPLSKKEGLIKDGVIKTNYIFTIAKVMVKKKICVLSPAKKGQVYEGIVGNLSGLRA